MHATMSLHIHAQPNGEINPIIQVYTYTYVMTLITAAAHIATLYILAKDSKEHLILYYKYYAN